MKARTFGKCKWCGAKIETTFGRVACEECNATAKSLGSSYLNGFAVRPGETRDEYIRRRMNERIAKREAENRGNRQCPYCGRRFQSNTRDYCPTCENDGLANVHRVTGRTNGWEKPTRKTTRHYKPRELARIEAPAPFPLCYAD